MNNGRIFTCEVLYFPEAVKGQHLEIVDILAKGGCDLNIGESDYEYKPIHVAIREGLWMFDILKKKWAALSAVKI